MAVIRDGVAVRSINSTTFDIIIGNGIGRSAALERFLARVQRRGCRVQRTGCAAAVRLFTFGPAADIEGTCKSIESMIRNA